MKILAVIGNDRWVDLYGFEGAASTYIGGLDKLARIGFILWSWPPKVELEFTKDSSLFVDLIQKGN